MTHVIETTAEALLRVLKARGVDYILANGGTDFATLIEALARGQAEGIAMPEAPVVAHETAAVAMAHGHYLVSGRPQAVMLHTNVGLANAVMGLINAATDNIPMPVMSGRTPVTERGRLGSRNAPIHWGQEMRDQAGMIRECVKWDYELRYPEQVPELVDRALAIAMTPPRGPVYLSLPREVLAEPWRWGELPASPLMAPATAPAPDPAAIRDIARILAQARNPLIVAQRGDGTERGFVALTRFADRFAIPVVEFWATRNAFPADHPMHAGFDPHPFVAEADGILVLDALVPWLPERATPPEACRVVHIGPDPLFARTPVRGFPSDVTLCADVTLALEALHEALDPLLPDPEGRRQALAKANRERRAAALDEAREGAGPPMTAGFVSRCLADQLEPEAAMFTELGCDPSVMDFARPGTCFAHALSGGLGWAMPAALGAKLAQPERTVVAAMGDGCHLFANPVACHQLAEALGLPILSLVFNNGIWNAVRRSVLAMHPDGHAARANRMPVTALDPSPDFAAIARAGRTWARRIDHGAELAAALAEALAVVREEKRPALLDLAVAMA